MDIDLSKAFEDSPEDQDDSPLTFGKYQGKTPDEISEIDPGYLVYLWEHTECHPFSRGMYNYCKSKVSKADNTLGLMDDWN